MKKIKAFSLQQWGSMIIALCITAFLIFVHSRGFISYDDGWFVYAASRLIHGEIPYKDFQYLYNPGSLYINAAAFLIFGESILSTRIFAFLFSVGMVVMLYLFGQRLKLPVWFTFISIASYVFWGPGHINFIWPVMIVILTGFVTNYLLLRGIETKDRRVRMQLLFFSGVTSALTLILKQNFGLAIVLNTILVFVFIKQYRNENAIKIHLIGYLLVWLVQILYFYFTNSLVIYLQEMYYFMFIKILQNGMLASPYPWAYPAPFLYMLAKLLFYMLPFLVGLITLGVTIWRKSNLFFFATFVTLYYILSIRPTTDYVHLVPLIAMMSISFMVLYALVKTKTQRGIMILIVSILSAVGLYTTLFSNYYRWEYPLITDSVYLDNPKAGIWTDPHEAAIANSIVHYIDAHTTDGEYIYIYGLSPMYYFLTNTKNPTRYDYFHTGVQTNDSVADTIAILQKKKINLILADAPLTATASPVTKFILQHYKMRYQLSHYYFFSL